MKVKSAKYPSSFPVLPINTENQGAHRGLIGERQGWHIERNLDKGCSEAMLVYMVFCLNSLETLFGFIGELLLNYLLIYPCFR